jgi:hypothetical protein
MDTSVTTDTNDGRRQLALAKLVAFQGIEAEFLRSFRFMEILQGQQRLPVCTVADSVRFLHALWICECKDKLLSILRSMGRYEGRRCLELMQSWQEGDISSVVGFLQGKLNNLSTAELSTQIHEARVTGNDTLADRLVHGRRVMVNRGFHLMQILDALFAFPEHLLREQVELACAEFGHAPAQIESQLAEMDSPLYAYAPHPLLARHNMLLMNELGISVTRSVADRPGNRTPRVEAAISPQPSYAELTVPREMTLISALRNNPGYGESLSLPALANTAEVPGESGEAAP